MKVKPEAAWLILALILAPLFLAMAFSDWRHNRKLKGKP